MRPIIAPRPEGTLTDAGPLLALVNKKNEPEQNARCNAALKALALPLVTTWPCLAEAMYLSSEAGGWAMQRLLWQYVSQKTLRVRAATEVELARIAVLMEQYQDRPMDLADASVVALAEAEGYARVFSIDSDFYVYRLADGSALEVVPGPFLRKP